MGMSVCYLLYTSSILHCAVNKGTRDRKVSFVSFAQGGSVRMIGTQLSRSISPVTLFARVVHGAEVNYHAPLPWRK